MSLLWHGPSPIPDCQVCGEPRSGIQSIRRGSLAIAICPDCKAAALAAPPFTIIRGGKE